MKRIIASIVVLLQVTLCQAAENVPTGLMCELMAFPERTVITDRQPDFCWIVNSPVEGDRQVAYRILVASSAEKLAADQGDMWDSGTVESSQSISVEYAGQPLQPGESYWWKVKTTLQSSSDAGWSKPQQFNTILEPSKAVEVLPAESHLSASHWIWYPENPGASTRYFRRVVKIPEGQKIAQATFLITVDDNFTLVVNGKKLAQTTEHNAWKTFRLVDLADVLKPGENNIQVEAINSGDVAGFTGRIDIAFESGEKLTIPVDTQWQVAETIDGPYLAAKSFGAYGAEPWKTTAMKPKAPVAVKETVTSDPLAYALPDRYLPVRTEVKPVKVEKIAEGHWYVDFGRAAYGTVRLAIDSREATEIDVHLGEERTPDAERLNREPGGTRRYRMMSVPVVKGQGTYEVKITPDKRNTGGAAILMPPPIAEVMPFRYCEITGCPAKLDADSIVQLAVHYPFDDSAASFTSSDETLNEVWEMCKYSMKATSFCGVYVDGDRERIPYEADAYINQLGHYCTDREFTMARYSHEYLILKPTWPTEWILHSVIMAWADYEQTGDAESMARYYDDLCAKTLQDLAREDGLICTKSVPPEVYAKIHHNRIRDIVDWPTGERDGYELKDINTVVCAFHYRSLVLMSKIAKTLGKEADAKDFAVKAERVARTINEKLFDTERGVYIDGEGSTHASIHANMFPLSLGLVPPERQKSVVEFVKSRGMACSVYGSQYLMEALYEAGEAEYALSLMRSKAERSWWNMIHEGSTIAMEAWGNRFKSNQDWNHAWGAAPANIIPRGLMGVMPLEPGFGRIRIRPQVGSLESASMTMPTIRGPVLVAFKQKQGESFTLEIEIPVNVTADVYVPVCGDGSSITMDGKTVDCKIEGKFAVIRDVSSGRHTFVSQ